MEIRPFRGWRYNLADVSDVIAPPYDVLTAGDKQRLLAGSDKNIVAVDLPHVPPAEAGPDEAYQKAADLLSQWIADGVIRQDEDPCLYAYEQLYRWAGKTYSRRSLLCSVRAGDVDGDVIPHEQTSAGPRADRLKLTEYTAVQLSPIFGFFEDKMGAMGDALASAVAGDPDARGELNGVTEKLWVLSASDVIRKIASALMDVPVFIADGHHRYTTAVNYRDALLSAGRIDSDHEANFVMFALVARDDPSLLILPMHRIVRNLSEDFAIDRLVATATEFSWQRCSVEDVDPTDAGAFLHRYGPGAMGFAGADPAEVWVAKLKDGGAMARAAPDQPEAWRSLDVAVLHKLIIDRALEPWRTPDLFIEYTADGRSVMAACESARAHLGVFLQSTPLQAVEQVALAGAVMPYKSTYFFPKLATGMVLKGLE
ncbi:MAG: DUF1015 domain-containing protein [Phycisphaerae bacterium]|nr:DUF1015 domain-containing protein [Phycisphaerae bacterium]